MWLRGQVGRSGNKPGARGPAWPDGREHPRSAISGCEPCHHVFILVLCSYLETSTAHCEVLGTKSVRMNGRRPVWTCPRL